MKSILKPDGSVTLGMATAITVWAIFDKSLPDTATIHATDPGDINVEQARKKAVYTSAAVLGIVTLMTKDVNVFILGGVVLFALDMHTRHANASSPATGALVSVAPGYDSQTLRSVS